MRRRLDRNDAIVSEVASAFRGNAEAIGSLVRWVLGTAGASWGLHLLGIALAPAVIIALLVTLLQWRIKDLSRRLAKVEQALASTRRAPVRAVGWPEVPNAHLASSTFYVPPSPGIGGADGRAGRLHPHLID